MDTTEEIAHNKTDSENHTEEKPEFTNQDAERLYASCLDIQKLDWGLQQEIQLAKLITKLRKWTAPISDSKEKFSKQFGFIQQNNAYVAMSKFSQEEKEENILKFNEEIDTVNKDAFEYWEELKAMIPLPLFNTKKLGDDIKFTGCTQKQYFIHYCIKSEN